MKWRREPGGWKGSRGGGGAIRQRRRRESSLRAAEAGDCPRKLERRLVGSLRLTALIARLDAWREGGHAPSNPPSSTKRRSSRPPPFPIHKHLVRKRKLPASVTRLKQHSGGKLLDGARLLFKSDLSEPVCTTWCSTCGHFQPHTRTPRQCAE